MPYPLSVCSATDEYISYIAHVRSLSEKTVESYRHDLDVFVSLLEEHIEFVRDIRLADVQLCIAQLSRKGRSASAINRFMASLRSFFSYCVVHGYCIENPVANLKTLKTSKKIPSFLFPSEVDELCELPKKRAMLWAERDSALLEMLYSSGCRVSELAGLTLDSVNADYSSAIVFGKGGKERRVFFAVDAQEALKIYLPLRLLRIPAETPTKKIFINMRGFALTVRGIQYIISEYSMHMANAKRIFPHALRHTFATSLVRSGADIRIVQEMMGHESISTTQRYTHVTTDELIRTYRQAHPHGGNDR